MPAVLGGIAIRLQAVTKGVDAALAALQARMRRVAASVGPVLGRVHDKLSELVPGFDIVSQRIRSTFSEVARAISAKVGRLRGAFATMGRGAMRALRPMMGLLRRLPALLSAAAAAAAGLFGGLGAAAAVKLASGVEDVTASFAVLLGGLEKARALITDLFKFAATTPFQFKDLAKTTRLLLAYGFAQEEILPTLRILGDVSSGLNVPIDQLAFAFGQVRVKARLMGEELRQLTNAGFNPLEFIARKTGKTQLQLRKEMEQGLITFDMVAEAFADATAKGGRFFNLMKVRSQTLSGLFSTLRDNVEIALVAIGQELVRNLNLKQALRNLIANSSSIAAVLSRFIKGVIAIARPVASVFASVGKALAPVGQAVVVLALEVFKLIGALVKLLEKTGLFDLLADAVRTVITLAALAVRAVRGLIETVGPVIAAFAEKLVKVFKFIFDLFAKLGGLWDWLARKVGLGGELAESLEKAGDKTAKGIDSTVDSIADSLEATLKAVQEGTGGPLLKQVQDMVAKLKAETKRATAANTQSAKKVADTTKAAQPQFVGLEEQFQRLQVAALKVTTDQQIADSTARTALAAEQTNKNMEELVRTAREQLEETAEMRKAVQKGIQPVFAGVGG